MDIDPALLRPGRFELAIFVPPLDVCGRRELLSKQLAKMHVEGCDVEHFVDSTEGFTGADLCNLCNRAGLIALSRNSSPFEYKAPTAADLEIALQQGISSVTPHMLQEIYDWEMEQKL